MNRADNLVKTARDGIKENAKEIRLLQQDSARLQKIIEMFGDSNVTYSPTTGRRASSGWKVGVSRDIHKLFQSMAPEHWCTQEEIASRLVEWSPETVGNAVNKMARDGKLMRQGDPGSYRYARRATALDSMPDRGTMQVGDGEG